MTDNSCLTLFSLIFLEDIGLNFFQIGCIGIKLAKVEKTYNENKPNHSLDDIANDFFNCLKTKIDTRARITATEIGLVLVFLILLTVVFLIIVAIFYVMLGNKFTPDSNKILLFIVFFSALFYIILGSLIIYNANMNITNSLNQIENDISTCINELVSELLIFENETQQAVDKALCSYPDYACPT